MNKKFMENNAAISASRGSMIMEILIALAVFSIICLPILLFIFSSEEFQIKKSRAASIAHDEIVTGNIEWFLPDNINGYSNRHSCDMALAQYAISSTTPIVSYPHFFSHQRNILSTIQYIPNNGRGYLVLGTNSSSTTDPDMYVFHADTHDPVGSIEFGPGTVDFDFFDSYIFVAQRSITSPVVRIPINSLFEWVPTDSATNTGMPQIDKAMVRSIFPGLFPVAAGLPLRILSSKDWIYIGLDKNTSRELNASKIAHRPSGDQKDDLYAFPIQSVEINAGINDMARTPYELIVGSPNPIEFSTYLLKAPAFVNGSSTALTGSTMVGNTPFKSLSEFILAKSFDAPGLSGNGKSIATYKKEAYFGRTVGNVELYKTSGLLDDVAASKPLPWKFSTIASADMNKTILQVEEVFGGSYLLALSKVPSPAIELLKRNQSGAYSMDRSVALPATTTSMTCAGRDIVVGMESTTTPIAIIKF